MNKLTELIADLRNPASQVAYRTAADRLQAIVDSMCSVALKACEPAGDSDECGIHWYDVRPGAMRRGTFKQPAVEQSGTEPEDYAERHLQMLDQQPSEPTEEAVEQRCYVTTAGLHPDYDVGITGGCVREYGHRGEHSLKPAPTEDNQHD